MLLETRGLTKTFQTEQVKTTALNNINLQIAQGEFVSVFGRSGSGKSTLLSILGLLERPSHGQYLLKGVDTASLEAGQLAALRNKHIGFIFQQFNLIDSMSVFENVALPLYYAGCSKADIKQKVQAVLALLDISQRALHKPNQLSGGQQQRVAIARALVNDPELLLVDEPTGNLDRQNSENVIATLQQLHQSGRTICLVTHDEAYAKVAQRIIHLADGEICLP